VTNTEWNVCSPDIRSQSKNEELLAGGCSGSVRLARVLLGC